MHRFFLNSIILFLLLFQGTAQAETIRVAVASNFSAAMKELVRQFQSTSTDQVKLSFGSTGKHYAQILHGAPFDIFFAADSKRPQLLESAGMVIQGTRFTYAYGRLVLWSKNIHRIDQKGQVLQQGHFKHLSIANPKLAPYGTAAMDVLQNLKLVDKIQPKLIYGENISQAYQFVYSENVELGFIALSQLKQQGNEIDGSYWLVPETMHRPIKQQAIQLKQSRAADNFLRFVKSRNGQNIIRQSGYDIKLNDLP